MLEKILNHQLWLDYLEYKSKNSFQIKSKQEYLENYIHSKSYLPVATEIVKGSYSFSIPQKHLLSKLGTNKKRTVYTFNEDETMILKFISYLLSEFDYVFADNCYAFIRGKGCKAAFYDILSHHDISNLYCYKIDISNYFNSIDIDLLMPIIKAAFKGHTDLYELFFELFLCEDVLFEGKAIKEHKGVMAGTPTAPFFANLYLKEMDEYFHDIDAIYARYSDDIILFGNEKEINNYIIVLNSYINKYKLCINPKKVHMSTPHSPWTFLGFEYNEGTIDLSKITKQKLKGKIKRQAKALMRWKKRVGADDKRMLRAMNIKFNRKFYSNASGNELSYSRWYFPVINTNKGLKEIDAYMQEIQRYMVTGRFSKANIKSVPYDFLKDCGYRPLVSEYYKKKVENTDA